MLFGTYGNRIILPQARQETMMPIYYFSETEHGDLAANEQGIEFDDLAAACSEAERALREIAAEAPLEQKTLWMTVFDENKKLVHRMRVEVTQEIGVDC
jgi:hypothetical protein